MAQNYKIFIKQVPVILTTSADGLSGERKNLVVNIKEKKDIKDVINYCEKQPFHSRVYLVHYDLNQLAGYFRSFYRLIEAAGGVVFNENRELLMIYRKKMWDLPKGKIEKGEEIPEAAKREVMEECGIRNLEVGEFFLTSYHTYRLFDDRILKKTTWYIMESSSEEKLVPQVEEDITDIRWMNRQSINKIYDGTFPNLRELLDRALKHMPD